MKIYFRINCLLFFGVNIYSCAVQVMASLMNNCISRSWCGSEVYCLPEAEDMSNLNVVLLMSSCSFMRIHSGISAVPTMGFRGLIDVLDSSVVMSVICSLGLFGGVLEFFVHRKIFAAIGCWSIDTVEGLISLILICMLIESIVSYWIDCFSG